MVKVIEKINNDKYFDIEDVSNFLSPSKESTTRQGCRRGDSVE
jgi:hypothetical protein